MTALHTAKPVAAMREAGVDITGQISQHFSEFSDVNFDYVVTLCDNAAERCPAAFGGSAKVIHKPFEDPYFATGTKEQVMAQFRKARDLIRVFVEGMPENLKSDK